MDYEETFDLGAKITTIRSLIVVVLVWHGVSLNLMLKMFS